MNTTRTGAFLIHALPPEVLGPVRASGVDALGNPVEQVTAGGGEPLRCCLRNARSGQEIILFGYQPPLPPSPYREMGAVFAHAHAHKCGGPGAGDRYPTEWYGRPQVLRAYDRRGWIHDSTRLHDGQDPEAVISEMLSDPAVVQIHSRNVAYGCFMFAITRAD